LTVPRRGIRVVVARYCDRTQDYVMMQPGSSQ